MTANESARLTAVVAPPEHGAVRQDWARVEAALHRRLPDDYKVIVDTYGPGTFFDTVRLWTPTAGYFNLAEHGSEQVTGSLAMTRDAIPFDDPELARLPDGQLHPIDFGDPDVEPPYFSWGVGLDGDVGFWHRNGENPNRWPILFGQLQCWDYHPGGLEAYLVGIITGTIPTNCLTGPHAQTFEPYQPE